MLNFSSVLNYHPRSPSRPNTADKDTNNVAKLKALNATILRLTESNQRLQSENKLLKQDLERALDEAMSDMGETPRAKKRRDRKRGESWGFNQSKSMEGTYSQIMLIMLINVTMPIMLTMQIMLII